MAASVPASGRLWYSSNVCVRALGSLPLICSHASYHVTGNEGCKHLDERKGTGCFSASSRHALMCS
eukprot:scaffold301414_cov22-Tisochrysis_lutea.AAC.2